MVLLTGDGAVPVFHRAYSGGAGEVGQVTAAMRACRELAAPRRFLLVGDSKLVSYGNLRDMIEAGVEFIAPASKTYVCAAELAALDRAAATEVDYVAQRDAQVPPEARGRWAVCEDTTTIRGKRTRDPVLVLRRAPRSRSGWDCWSASSRCAGVASRCSTMAAGRPPSRITRP